MSAEERAGHRQGEDFIEEELMVVRADTGDAVADPDPAIFETCEGATVSGRRGDRVNVGAKHECR